MKTALALLRSRCNYSQALAARALGVSRQVLGAWESGAKSIPVARQDQIARLLGVDRDLITEPDLDQVAAFCDRPMFSHTFEGRQVFSFSPAPESRVYLEGPAAVRPEERGAALMNRKHAMFVELDALLSFTPGRQADELPAMESAVALLSTFYKLLKLAERSEPAVALRLLRFFQAQLTLLAAAMGDLEGQPLPTPAEQHQLLRLRALWARENRRMQNSERLPEPQTRAEWLAQLAAYYQQARFDGWNRAEMQWRLNQWMNGAFSNETD